LTTPQRPLAGRAALVTGASRGIGASTAAHLARLGANVTLVARDAAALQRVAQAVGELESQALCVTCDLRDPAATARAFASAREAFGPLEILVNNAAALHLGPFQDLSSEDWATMSELNLGAALRCAQHALRDMLPRARGVIVNVASVAGVSGVPTFPGLVGYATTKGGLIAFSEALGAEVAPQGVRVLAVSPGSVQTDMLRAAAPEHVEDAMTPGQVGRVIARLACDESAALHQSNVILWGAPRAPERP
jgi:NAD(P)-dependent dehydrogenase (short-subunit alcohol dehydrogenase family)